VGILFGLMLGSQGWDPGLGSQADPPASFFAAFDVCGRIQALAKSSVEQMEASLMERWQRDQVPADLLPGDLLPKDLLPGELLPEDLVPRDLLPWWGSPMQPVRRLRRHGVRVWGGLAPPET